MRERLFRAKTQQQSIREWFFWKKSRNKQATVFEKKRPENEDFFSDFAARCCYRVGDMPWRLRVNIFTSINSIVWQHSTFLCNLHTFGPCRGVFGKKFRRFLETSDVFEENNCAKKKEMCKDFFLRRPPLCSLRSIGDDHKGDDHWGSFLML